MISLAMFWFMVCGTQTWMTSFLENGVGAKDTSAQVFVIVLNLTTPVGAAIIGNILFTVTGGYQSPRALPICILITLATTIITAPIPWLTNVALVYTLFFLAQLVAIMFTPAALAIMLD